MPKYLIPNEMAPGVYREGVGFFMPGEVITLPDLASKPGDAVSASLKAMDAEALAYQKASLLAAAEAAKKARAAKPKSEDALVDLVAGLTTVSEAAPAKSAAVSDGAPQTVAQVAGGKPSKREADK